MPTDGWKEREEDKNWGKPGSHPQCQGSPRSEVAGQLAPKGGEWVPESGTGLPRSRALSRLERSGMKPKPAGGRDAARAVTLMVVVLRSSYWHSHSRQ